MGFLLISAELKPLHRAVTKNVLRHVKVHNMAKFSHHQFGFSVLPVDENSSHHWWHNTRVLCLFISSLGYFNLTPVAHWLLCYRFVDIIWVHTYSTFYRFDPLGISSFLGLKSWTLSADMDKLAVAKFHVWTKTRRPEISRDTITNIRVFSRSWFTCTSFS